MRADIIIQQINGLLLMYPELAEDDVLRADMIEGETDAFEFLRVLERKRQESASLAGAIASNIADMEIRQGRFERREQAMRTLMFKVMNACDIRKAELAEATLSIRNGTPKVIVTDETRLPEWAIRIKREPDKKQIGELLKSGTPVEGAELSNAEPTLSIRTR
jgi:hypothetical protein